MGLELSHGGHLTHGMKINVSGRLYEIAPYHVDRETSLIDMDEVERIAHERRPKVIIAGWSAYPRFLDFERFRAIADEVGAYLMVDMAHFAGLVAAGLHPSPVPHAQVVTTTIHKTIGGGRGGMILCTEELAKQDRLRGFPRSAGRPARARDRGQGGGAEDRRVGAVPRAPGADAGGRPGGRVGAAGSRRRRERADRRYRRAPRALRPARVQPSTASRPRTGWPRSGSPSTATRCRSIPARRPSRRGCGLERRRWRRAGCKPRTSSRSARSLPPRLRLKASRGGARSWRADGAIAERYPLYAGLGAAAIV